MAVAVDASTEQVRTNTVDPLTFSHAGRDTGSGGVQGVLVWVINASSATDHIAGITYGGQSLTRLARASDTATEPGDAQVWFLGENVPDGTQDVSVDFTSATGDDFHVIVTTLTGDRDLRVLSTATISENATNPQAAMPHFGVAGALSLCAIYSGLAAPSNLTLLSDMTAIHDHDFGSFVSRVDQQTTASDTDFTIGYTASGDDVAFVAVTIAEAVPTGAGAQFVGRGSNNAGTGSNSSASVQFPPGIEADDVAILFVSGNSGSSTITPDAESWTEIGSQLGNSTTLYSSVFWAVLDGSEDLSTLSITLGTSQRWNVTLAVFRGLDTTSPIDTFATAQTTSVGTTVTTPVVTPSVDDVITLALATGRGDVGGEAATYSGWGGQYTEIADQSTTSATLSNNSHAMAYRKASGGGGSSHNPTDPTTSTNQTRTNGYTIALKPAAGLTAVGQNLVALWNVRAAVGKNVVARWNVLTSVGKNVVARWNVRALAGRNVIARWNVRAVVNRTLTAKWNVRATVNRTLSALWNVRITVGRNNTHRWAVRSLATKNLVTRWNVRALVGRNNTHRWNVRANVGRNSTYRWNVRALVGRNNTYRWNVREAVGRNATLLWNVAGSLTSVGRNLVVRWNVREAVGRNSTYVWAVRSLIQPAADLLPAGRALNYPADASVWGTYQVAASGSAGTVTKTVETSDTYTGPRCIKVDGDGAADYQGVQTWAGGAGNDGMAPASPSTAYTASAWVKANAGETIQITVHEFNAARTYVGETSSPVTATGQWQKVAATRTLSASGAFVATAIRRFGTSRASFTMRVSGVQIEQAATATNFSPTLRGSWHARSLAGRPLVARWNVRALVNRTLTTRWNVRAVVNRTLTTRWNVRALVSRTLTAKWDVRAVVGQSATFVWNVAGSLATVGRNLVARWNVRATVGKSETLKWNVRQWVGLEVIARWNVRALAANTLTARWTVRALVNRAVTARWGVRALVGREMTARWNVRAAVGKSLTAVWRVLDNVLWFRFGSDGAGASRDEAGRSATSRDEGSGTVTSRDEAKSNHTNRFGG